MSANYTAGNLLELRNNYHPSQLKDLDFRKSILENPGYYISRHLEEIVNMGYNLPQYLKYAQLALYINYFNIQCLVETGTFGGDCCDFFKDTLKNIYTIDIDPYCYNNALRNFKNYPNIKPILGDSGKVLADVIKNIDERTLFFLDGHYTHVPDDREDGYHNLRSDLGETPIIQELLTIYNHPIDNHIIIIDDCGCFANVNHKDYPSIDEMRNFCGELFPNHLFIPKYGSIYLVQEEVSLVPKLNAHVETSVVGSLKWVVTR